MGGKKAPDVSKAIDEVVATKDISPTPSAEYQDTESMKGKAIRGDTSSFPTESADMRPMGDPVEKKAARRVSPRSASAAATVRSTTPAASSVSTTRGVSPSAPADSGGRTVVIPNNPRPPVDNEKRPSKPAKGGDNTERKSKPYPADQAVQKLGLTFKDADNASKADPNNAAKKKERDRAYKTYLDAMKAMKR